jgi:hypothetical protein
MVPHYNGNDANLKEFPHVLLEDEEEAEEVYLPT